MKYIDGKLPVKYIHIAWYSDDCGGNCFDEDFVPLERFDSRVLARIMTEDEKDWSDKSRIFIKMKDGREYELMLRKVNNREETTKFSYPIKHLTECANSGYYCPCCSKKLSDRDKVKKYKFCYNCGKELNWNNIEEL